MQHKTRLALLFTLALTLLVSTIAYATTITIDGIDDPWPVGSQVATDPNTDETNGGMDLTAVYFTNSATTLYWRFDTELTPLWGPPSTTLNGMRYIEVCIDSNGDGDGFNNASCNCNTPGTSFDYILRVNDFGGTDTVDLLDANTCTTTSPSGIAVGSTGSTLLTEVSLPISNLANFPASCTSGSSCTINAAVANVNNFNGLYRDVVPAFSITIPGPTAVSLQQTGVSSSGSTLLWAAVTGLLLLITAAFLWRRRAAR